MSQQHDGLWVWTIGRRDNGQSIIGGPFADDNDAAEATSNQSGVRFVRLGTRDRNAALPQLRHMATSTRAPRRAVTVPADPDYEPPPEHHPRKKGFIQKLFARKPKSENDEPEDDDSF